MSTKNNDTEFDDGKLEYESPLLTKLKQSPIDFKEPEGYFEDFNRKLNERIKYEQPTISPVKKTRYYHHSFSATLRYCCCFNNSNMCYRF